MKPKLVVALGATAARSLTGKPVPINRLRGQVLPLDEVRKLVVTIHPSALLRIRDSDDKKREFLGLVDDLRFCAKILRSNIGTPL